MLPISYFSISLCSHLLSPVVVDVVVDVKADVDQVSVSVDSSPPVCTKGEVTMFVGGRFKVSMFERSTQIYNYCSHTLTNMGP